MTESCSLVMVMLSVPVKLSLFSMKSVSLSHYHRDILGGSRFWGGGKSTNKDETMMEVCGKCLRLNKCLGRQNSPVIWCLQYHCRGERCLLFLSENLFWQDTLYHKEHEKLLRSFCILNMIFGTRTLQCPQTTNFWDTYIGDLCPLPFEKLRKQ